MAAPADRTGAFRALHETGCFVIPNPWDVGSARVPRAARLPGARHDQLRVRLVAGPARQRRVARRGAGAPPGDRRGRRRAGQRRLRGRLRGRAGRRRGATSPRRRRPGSPGSRSRTRPATRRSRCSTFDARGRADPGGARGRIDESGTGRPAHRPLRGLHRRPARSRRDDPPAHRVRRGRRGLPLRARDPQPRRTSRPSSRRSRPSRSTCWSAATSPRSPSWPTLGVRRISVGGALARAAWAGFLAGGEGDRRARDVHRVSRAAVPFAEIDGAFRETR